MSAWSGKRQPKWKVELLDAEDFPLRELLGVKSGKIDVMADSLLGASGRCVISSASAKGVGLFDERIDWLNHRVRFTYDPGIPGLDPWAVATLRFTSPRDLHSAEGLHHDSTLLSKVSILDEDEVSETYSLPAGTAIIPVVDALIRTTGEGRIAATPSTKTLSASVVWEAGTPKLTIINDLLKAAGYWSVWCDGSGQFRLEPYTLPKNRPSAFIFAAGEASIHKPDWTREQDLSSVPNRVVVVQEGSGDDDPIIGLAENTDTSSPFSFHSRGRWITRTVKNVEVADGNAANLLAQRYLLDSMAPVERFDVDHAIVPLEPNQAVTFRPTRGPVKIATVQRMSFTLDFDSQCSAEWRGVQDVG